MEELDEEKFIISKEDFEKYFTKNKYVDKEEMLLYYGKNYQFFSRLFPDLVLNNYE